MKRILMSAVILSMSSAMFAAETGPGCGLGSQVFDGKNGPASHILAATTNGTSGNQTFGMTSGTLGCNVDGTIRMASLYMDANVDKIASEMSKGQGESLNALAELLGIGSAHKTQFYQLVRRNFSKIFVSAKTTSRQALDNLVALMAKDQVLHSYIG